MVRNIAVQSIFQLILLLVLMFTGADLFGVHFGEACARYSVDYSANYWDVTTNQKVGTVSSANTVTCSDIHNFCSGTIDTDCYKKDFTLNGNVFDFDHLDNFAKDCLECTKIDYTHGTIIFNAFIFCQIFNEYSSRSLFDDWNFLKKMDNSWVFFAVSVFSVGAQIFLVELGGDFVKTSHLTANQWLVTVALGFLTWPLGVAMRFFPVAEDPNSFFDHVEPAPVEVTKDGKSYELV